MSEKQLNAIIKKGYAKRLAAYNRSVWYLAQVPVAEAGVWKRAGGLPLNWTNDSLLRTATLIRERGFSRFRVHAQRAKKVIPLVLNNSILLEQQEKYLLPIGFKHGTGTPARSRLKRKVAVDIDDGCMRSIAMAVSGKRLMRMYVGMPE